MHDLFNYTFITQMPIHAAPFVRSQQKAVTTDVAIDLRITSETIYLWATYWRST